MTLNTRTLYHGSVGVGTTSPYQTVPAVAIIDNLGNHISEFKISAGIVTVTNIISEVEIKNDAGNPIPVSGIVTATGPLTDSQLRASAVPVSDNNSSLTVDGKAYRSTVTITRPSNTTAYTAGDVIGDTGGSAIITLNNIGPSGGYVLIQSSALIFSDSSVPSGMSAFRVHFYSASPTAIADNAVFNLQSGDRTNYMGFIEFPTPQDFGDTIYTQVDYPGRMIKLASASTVLYAEIETRGGYTPVSGSTVELRVSTLEAGL